MTKKIRLVCFSVNVYNVIAGKTEGFGGAETQMWNVARAFATHGDYDVHLITVTDETTRSFDQEGVRVHPIKPAGDLTPQDSRLKRLSCVWRYYMRIARKAFQLKGDVYYVNMASSEETIIWAVSRLRRKPFIHRVASDMESSAEHIRTRLFFGSKMKTRLLVRVLRKADLVITQSQNQQQAMEQNLGVKSERISNLHIMPHLAADAQRNDVLWVGRAHPVKQAHLFPELARLLPDFPFRMVLAASPAFPQISEQVSEVAGDVTNLTLSGGISTQEVDALYQQARVVVMTSEMEGFSNVLIEALKNGAPVVSLRVNPDDIFAEVSSEEELKPELGYVVGDSLETAAAVIGELLRNDDLWKQSSKLASDYARHRFSAQSVISLYDEKIRRLLNRSA